MARDDRSIFRQEALDRLASPERLDELLQLVRPRDWIALVVLAVLVVSGVVWSLVATVPVTVGGRGAVVRPQRVVAVQASGDARVLGWLVVAGQEVQAGQLLARLELPALRQRLEHKRAELVDLQQRYALLRPGAEKHRELQRAALVEQRATLQRYVTDTTVVAERQHKRGIDAVHKQREELLRTIEQVRYFATELRERLDSYKKLFKAGALTREQILGAERAYGEQVSRQGELQAQLPELIVREVEIEQTHVMQLKAISDARTQVGAIAAQLKRLELAALEQEQAHNQQADALQHEADKLALELARQSELRATHAARVLELIAVPGQLASRGQRLATLEVRGDDPLLRFVGFFSIKDGKRIHIGDAVAVSPDSVERARFGSVRAKVTSVGAFPAAAQRIQAVLGSEALASGYSQQPVLEVVAELSLDPETVSGLSWTSSKGPEFPLTMGTTAAARVSIERRAPISYVLPFLREWFGGTD